MKFQEQDFMEVLDGLKTLDSPGITKISFSTKYLISCAADVIIQSLNSFGTNRLAIFFTGGKDSTVLLYILLASLIYFNKTSSLIESSIPIVYIDRGQQKFEEEQIFTTQLANEFESIIVESKIGVFLGVRASDSNKTAQTSEVQKQTIKFIEESETQEGWPQSVRIMPLLNWDYSNIWEFLLGFGFNYTSLGLRTNTLPNPYLRKTKRQVIDKLEKLKQQQQIPQIADIENSDKHIITIRVIQILETIASSFSTGDEASLDEFVYLPAYALDDGSHERDVRMT
ncbi:MAG: FAD synthetase [Streblomastix strix]|uniref:FAD synthase n=1 Tax=Streblomastix strix TaxID=222440 RepID=A0A5J4WKE5_9EUKA|nr:MAG: FAD synthetase [Streblomastix strix]